MTFHVQTVQPSPGNLGSIRMMDQMTLAKQQHPTFLLLPPAEHDVIWCVTSLGQLCWLCPLTASCASQPSCWWSGERNRKDLGAVQVLLSNNYNFSLLPAQIRNTEPQELPGRELTLPQPKSTQTAVP